MSRPPNETEREALQDFDRYCAEHVIQPGEFVPAFGAWLHERVGWDGRIEKLGEKRFRIEPDPRAGEPT